MPERKISYQMVVQKTDSGFLVQAPSWQRLYIDAGLSLTDILVKQDLIAETEKRLVYVGGDSKEKLMANWLTEIFTLFQQHKFIAKRIVFDQFDGKTIGATLWGEKYVPTKHGSVLEVSAIAEENLKMGDEPSSEPLFFARIFFKK